MSRVKKHCLPLAILLFVLVPLMVHAADMEKNTLTFENRSGRGALVKLIGPSKKVVLVPDGEDKTVNIASGRYFILVRYGDKPPYNYTRGDKFEIKDVVGGYIRAFLTLHGVVNGNYSSFPSSEREFYSY